MIMRIMINLSQILYDLHSPHKIISTVCDFPHKIIEKVLLVKCLKHQLNGKVIKQNGLWTSVLS